MKTTVIPPELMELYERMRKIIDFKTQRIIGLSRMLQTLKYCVEDTIPISPEALSVWAKLIDDATCDIIAELDAFTALESAQEE
ncbi:MAG: hypothetical protein WC959_01470 [Kiritimatiellales bacterium]